MDRDKINKRLFGWYSIFWVLLFVALYLSYFVYFVDITSTKSKWVGLFAGAIAILLASCKALEMSFYKSKNPMFEKITEYFSNGAFIFIKRLFKISLVFIFLISCFLIKFMGNHFVLCFICGSAFTFLLIFLSVLVSTKISTRSSQFYNESNSFALKQIFNSSVVISFIMVGLCIIPLVILFHIIKDYQVLNGFVFGCAFVVLLNNVSTAISRQAVESADDVSRNHVAEYEKNDRRNPLLLLSGVSKCILGINTLSCDLFVSLSLALIASMTVGGEFLQLMGSFLPIIILASGIFASIISIMFINFNKITNPLRVLFSSAFFANVIFVIISYFVIRFWLPDLIYLFYPIVIGAFGGYFICFLNSNLLYSKYKPVVDVSNSAISGFLPTYRQIIKESFSAIFSPAVVVALVLIFSFVLSQGLNEPSAGLYGVTLAVLAMLSCSALMIGICSFGFTTKNVYKVLDTYEEDICEKENVLSNSLDGVGFHIVALGKNYINFATMITVVSAIMAYCVLSCIEEIDLINPYVLSSLFIGVTIPFIYSAFVMGIVSKTARRLVLEVKRQLKKFPQVLRFEMRPDYEKCVDISAISSLIQVIISTILVIIISFLIVFNLQKEAFGGYIFGVLVASFCLVYMTNSSCVLVKSAKRFFENQFNYIKNTDEYNAISLNEEIFCSFKSLINPSLNALLKFLVILALSLIPLFS